MSTTGWQQHNDSLRNIAKLQEVADPVSAQSSVEAEKGINRVYAR